MIVSADGNSVEVKLVREPRDFWDKAQAAAVLAIPIVVAIVGAIVNITLENRDIELRRFEVAVTVLKEDPRETPEMAALREWAITTFVEQTGLPDAARKELRETALPQASFDFPEGRIRRWPGPR